jgi:hypothetical protein
LLLEGNKVKTKQKKRERERPFLGGVEYFFFFFSFTCRTAHAHALLAFSVLSIDIKRVYNTARLLLLVADCWHVWGGLRRHIYISP